MLLAQESRELDCIKEICNVKGLINREIIRSPKYFQGLRASTVFLLHR
jgi:hypothetical protein